MTYTKPKMDFRVKMIYFNMLKEYSVQIHADSGTYTQSTPRIRSRVTLNDLITGDRASWYVLEQDLAYVGAYNKDG